MSKLIPEQKMRELGAARAVVRIAKAKFRGRASSVQGGARAVLRDVVPRLADHVVKSIEDTSHRPGPNAGAFAKLDLLPPRVSSYIAVRTVLDSLGRHRGLAAIAGDIGRKVESEVRFAEIKKAVPWLYRWALSRVKQSNDPRYRRKALTRTFNRAEEHLGKWLDWSTAEHVTLGTWFIEALRTAEKPIIRVEEAMSPGGRRKRHVLLPTEELARDIADLEQRTLQLVPWYLPMNVVPKPWDEKLDGGYYTWPSRLVKRKFASASGIDLKVSDPALAFQAVNALQATAWKVNEDVLDVALHFWKQQVNVGGMGDWVPVQKPERPAGVPEDVPIKDLPDDQKAEMKAWKRACVAAHTRELARTVSMIGDSHILAVARMFKDQARIYFPHALDFRGRVYPAPHYLQPQGRDLERGLLRFAEGKQLGVEGAWWLAVHGANVYGLDKIGMNDRVDWALSADTLEMVHSIAEDPYCDTRWEDTDKPFQFLAWCLEWSAYIKAGEPEDFLSFLPVAMDGSCNGLQHFAAMMRDEHGGKAVNLVPNGSQQDVYGLVAEALKAKLALDGPTVKVAREWLASGLVDRKLVKRQVMTVPYGVTKFGMRGQLRNELSGRLDTCAVPFEDLKEALGYLNSTLWDCIGEVVVSAKVAMTFLQECTKAVNGRVRWTTPAELVVQQEYHSLRDTQVRTVLLGGVRLALRVPTQKLDPRKQGSAVAPNFVHSLDAAHLMLTIDLMGEGISWAMVHDSYGCHAGDASALASALRKAFVLMYHAHDMLAEFRAGVQAAYPDVELPEVPAKGGLDIHEVLKAEFFFN